MSIYKDAIDRIECAFAYHKAVFDDNKNMIDYIFLDVNTSFELLTGLKKDDIIGKRFIKDIAQEKQASKKWLKIYQKVVVDKEEIEFEEYSEEYRKHYLIKAYSPLEDHFVTVFINKTFERNLLEMSEYFMTNIGSNIDYDKIAKFAYDVTGASYVAFNLFDENGKEFTTVALFGITENIKDGLRAFSIDPIGKKWAYDSIREEKIKDQEITYFSSLSELSKTVFSTSVIEQLEKSFELGQVAVAKISKEGKSLGDFTLVFKKEETILNVELFQLYLSHLGLFIEKTRLEKSFADSQKRFYTLAEYAPIGFISCDKDGNILYANAKLLVLMDSPSIEATKTINLLSHAELKANGFSQKLIECMKTDHVITHEMFYTSIWKKERWLKIYFTPIKENEKVIGANIVLDDISTKKKAENELRETAFRDALTNVYNRYALDTFLTELLHEARDNDLIGCLAVIDLDDFKFINDNYGHAIGDSVLKYFSKTVEGLLRDGDMFIRTGGDEFLIFLNDIKEEKNANMIIERIFNKISTIYNIEDTVKGVTHNINVACSIGASFFPRNGQTFEELMKNADEILYKIKRASKSGYGFVE